MLALVRLTTSLGEEVDADDEQQSCEDGSLLAEVHLDDLALLGVLRTPVVVRDTTHLGVAFLLSESQRTPTAVDTLPVASEHHSLLVHDDVEPVEAFLAGIHTIPLALQFLVLACGRELACAKTHRTPEHPHLHLLWLFLVASSSTYK